MMGVLAAMSRVAGQQLYVDDVFSAYTYTGNGSTQTITNGIDLAGKGGMVWTKRRDSVRNHNIGTTALGATGSNTLRANTTVEALGDGTQITAFNSNGYALGAYAESNEVGSFISWTFRNAPNFYHHSTVTKSAGSNATYSFSTISTLGMVRVKRTDVAGSWYVWHRSLTAGKLLVGETTAAEATLGHITVSGTTLTLVDGVIADGDYLVEAWAHDTISQCSVFTTDGSGNATVTLGWEPQFCIIKGQDVISDWFMLDQSRAWVATASIDRSLSANTSAAEVTTANYGAPTSTGFTVAGMTASKIYVYCVIRRPNKPPTVGTQVYNAIARTGTGAAATVTGVGFAPDLHAVHSRSGTTGGRWEDRLRGATQELVAETTAAEATVAQSVTAFDMDGSSIGTDGDWNTNTATYIDHYFKRAPGVFDQICYTGTGVAKTEAHNLGVVPELIIVKKRSGLEGWGVYQADTGNTYYLRLDLTVAKQLDSNAWNSTTPTSTAFTVGSGGLTNESPFTYVGYLFATKEGISKVGSYTGNGSNQTINCGFSGGARFILIKRTDSTGDWYIWDTVRGIVAGNDPHISLNTTAAEVTTDDSIDSDSSGFIVNQDAATNINVNLATYIYLSIS